MTALISNYSLDIPTPTSGTTQSIIGYKAVPIDNQNESVTLNVAKPYFLNYRILSLLSDFKNLPDNWDNDGSLSPHPNSISAALYLYLVLEKSGQKIYHAAPGAEGEIMIDLRNEENKRSLELIFYPKRSIYVTFSDDDTPKQGHYSFQLLPDLLEWLNYSKRE